MISKNPVSCFVTTNFLARNHGFSSGTPLAPSDYLDIAISSDQLSLLNPTIRDVQTGTIIDQCTGDAARKVIAKRRIDMVTGNINRYARVLNGPHQLEKIRTYNELAATMAVLKTEKEQQQKEQREKKKKEDEEKAARRAEKESAAITKAAELEPVCKGHVEKGIAHVLSLTLPVQREIIRFHFKLATVDINGVSIAVYKLKLAEAGIALNQLMPALPLAGLPDELETNNGVGDDEDVMRGVISEAGV